MYYKEDINLLLFLHPEFRNVKVAFFLGNFADGFCFYLKFLFTAPRQWITILLLESLLSKLIFDALSMRYTTHD
jgi:hypothetical protein